MDSDQSNLLMEQSKAIAEVEQEIADVSRSCCFNTDDRDDT